MPPSPKVTVITVVFNGARHLRDCLRSVAAQEGVLFEHVVIDGGSTDGCVDLLEQWSERLAYWNSEPDFGIADAMNKGLRQSHGEWIVFLHADDYFPESSSLASAIGCLDDRIDVAAFPVLFGLPPNLKLVQPRPAGILLNLKLGMCHQGMLTRRDLFLTLGDHDTSFRIAMDYEFFLRAYRNSSRFATFYAPTLAVMRDTGISSRVDWTSLKKRFQEDRVVHIRYAKGPAQRIAYRLYWLVYLSYRRLRTVFRS